jgi:hypothetical protein
MSDNHTELVETYTNFLKQLIKTKCMYKNESEKDDYVLRRTELLYNLLETLKIDKMNDRLESFISFFNSFVSVVNEKKPCEITNIEFFQYFCKALEKKHTKSFKVFFLNDEKVNINIGMIARNQSSHNFNQIKNYVYIMYIQACNILYSEISNANNQTQHIYNKLLEDFSIDKPSSNGESNNLKEEIKKLCSSVLEEVMPNEMGNKNMFDDIFNNKEFSGIFDNVIKTIGKDHNINLEEELKKTNKEEIVDAVNNLKKDFDKLNIFDMLKNLDINNIGDSINQVKSQLGKTMGAEDDTVLDETLNEVFSKVSEITKIE